MTTVDAPAHPFISVLLPVRGESWELAECLASLARQTYPRDRFEVLIADASDQPIAPAMLSSGLDWHVYPNPARIMSPGLNMLAGHARGDYMAIVSAHSYLPDDYFERMVGAARATGAANVGTRVLKVARSPWGRAIAAATSSPFGVGSSVQHHGTEPGPADSHFREAGGLQHCPGPQLRRRVQRPSPCRRRSRLVRAGRRSSVSPPRDAGRPLQTALSLWALEGGSGQAGCAGLPATPPRYPWPCGGRGGAWASWGHSLSSAGHPFRCLRSRVLHAGGHRGAPHEPSLRVEFAPHCPGLSRRPRRVWNRLPAWPPGPGSADRAPEVTAAGTIQHPNPVALIDQESSVHIRRSRSLLSPAKAPGGGGRAEGWRTVPRVRPGSRPEHGAQRASPRSPSGVKVTRALAHSSSKLERQIS